MVLMGVVSIYFNTNIRQVVDWDLRTFLILIINFNPASLIHFVLNHVNPNHSFNRRISPSHRPRHLAKFRCRHNQSTLIPVLEELHRSGGKLIDSSPMYGKSEMVIGNLTSKLKSRNNFFYATKVWTTGKQAGIDQMKSSMKKMQRDTIDLMQIHNLLDWKTHLPVLREGSRHYKIYWHHTLPGCNAR